MYRSVRNTLLLVLAVSAIGYGQGRGVASFAISGRVVVPVSGFQEYFEILLLQNAEQVVAHTYADANGRYRFSGLSRGTYFIAISLEGFEPVRQRVDLGIPGETIINIILDFKQERVISRPVDYSGEEDEVVDIVELRRTYPSGIVNDYREAEENLSRGNTEKAQEQLEAIIQEAPDFYDAHKTLGAIYQKAARYRDAETAYRQAQDLKPASAAPLVSLGSLYIEEASVAGLSNTAVRRILDQALDNLEEAVKIKPDASFAHYLLGVAYYKSAFYEDAEDHLKQALELKPPVPHTRLALANVYIRLQEWPDALVQLEGYLQENPDSPDRQEVFSMRARIAERASQSAGGSR